MRSGGEERRLGAAAAMRLKSGVRHEEEREKKAPCLVATTAAEMSRRHQGRSKIDEIIFFLSPEARLSVRLPRGWAPAHP